MGISMEPPVPLMDVDEEIKMLESIETPSIPISKKSISDLRG